MIRCNHWAMALAAVCVLSSFSTAQGSPRYPASPAMISAGKKLVFSRKGGNCIACHLVKGADMAGNIAQPLEPPFPGPQRLYAQIWDARQNYSNTIMPPYGADHLLSKRQIREIMAFLYSQN